jgi:hypothetical protein
VRLSRWRCQCAWTASLRRRLIATLHVGMLCVLILLRWVFHLERVSVGLGVYATRLNVQGDSSNPQIIATDSGQITDEW